MINLILLAIVAVVGLFTIMSVAHLGKAWLYTAILANLFFISIFGAKLVSFYGLTTNAGNVFYACIFFATYLLIEHYGAKEARQSIWLGFLGVTLFVIMSQVMVSLEGAKLSVAANNAILTLFELAPRIAFASIISFIITQYFNIWLYATLRQKTGRKFLWARATAAIFSAQAIDSILFFLIAFAGTMPISELTQTLWVGYSLKVAVGLVSIPLLYLSLKFKEI